MADRIANIIILAEDQEHQNLARRYLLRANRQNRRGIRPVPLPGNRQSGSQYVREQFPKQVKECRQRLGRGASCLLIVLTDADNLTTHEREATLHDVLTQEGQSAVEQTDPIMILIPKWQVETWIKCLLNESVSEDDRDTDRPPVTAAQVTAAARTLYDWTRPQARVGATCVPSLMAALPRWRRIA